MFRYVEIIRQESGQSTVEAAIMIPIIFLLMLLLIQPGILLYDRCVMLAAAQEGSRVLATCPDSSIQELVMPYIKRRLGSIPQQDNFHVHSTGCSYKINTSGSQNSQIVDVEITNEVEPLPLIGFLSSILGILNSNKNFEITVKASQQTGPTWANNSPYADNVDQWIGAWLN